jgi:pilus assembly protein Flp/PilA
MRRLTLLISDKRAVTALEYALLAALVALAIVGGTKTFGTSMSTFFNHLATTVNSWPN